MQLEEIAKKVLAMYEKAIASADVLPSDREELSARACTFADMCGSAAMQEEMERRHAARSALSCIPPACVMSSITRPDISWLISEIYCGRLPPTLSQLSYHCAGLSSNVYCVGIS